MPQFLAIASLATTAIGAGLSYVSANNAAKTQETLSLLNAQAQTQAIEQTGAINQMQAALNERLAQKDKEATEANANMVAQQAELGTRASIEATRRSRVQAAEFAANQVASLAKGGFADTTGSPLALLADTAEKSQMEADAIRYEDEQRRRNSFRDVSILRNQGVLAGLNVGQQRLAGMAAGQQMTRDLAQSRLNYQGQRAAASAARTKATGGLINSAGGLAYQGYGMFKDIY